MLHVYSIVRKYIFWISLEQEKKDSWRSESNYPMNAEKKTTDIVLAPPKGLLPF